MTALRRLPEGECGQGSGQAPRTPSGIDRWHRQPTPSARQSPTRVPPHPRGSLPGSAAQTRADACRPSGTATLPARMPLRYWLVGGSALAVSVSVSGFGPGFSSPPWLLVTWASTGPGGAPVGGATVVVRAGQAPASFRRALLACSFAAFTAWRPRLVTASQPASRPRPTSGRLHGLRAGLRRCLGLCRDITSTSRPPPADWVALLFPYSGRVKRTAARWRGTSQASRDRLPPADPHQRRPHPLGIGQSSRSPRGLAPSGESMTTPKRPWPSGSWLPPRSATASSPRPGSTTRSCHGRVA